MENFPILEGTSILSRLPTVERWAVDLQTIGEFTDYWKQRGYAPVEYYDEHADVPTLYLGGWYDSYARNTTESYAKLSKLKQSPQRLMMGPWTHAQYEVTHSGDIDFGLDAQIDYNDLKLAWFDHYLKRSSHRSIRLERRHLLQDGRRGWRYERRAPAESRRLLDVG